MLKEDFYAMCAIIPWGMLSLVFGLFAGVSGICLQILCFAAYKQEKHKRFSNWRNF